MPTVPQYTSQVQASARAPQVRVPAPTPDNFGASMGGALKSVGENAFRIAELVDRQQQIAGQKSWLEYKAKADALRQEFVTTSSGSQSAIDSQALLGKLTELRGEYTAGLPQRGVREFDDNAKIYNIGFESDIMRHVARETHSESIAVNNQMMAVASADFSGSLLDQDEARRVEAEKQFDRIHAEAMRLRGYSPENAAIDLSVTKGAAYAATFNNLAKSDPRAAIQFYEQYPDRFSKFSAQVSRQLELARSHVEGEDVALAAVSSLEQSYNDADWTTHNKSIREMAEAEGWSATKLQRANEVFADAYKNMKEVRGNQQALIREQMEDAAASGNFVEMRAIQQAYSQFISSDPVFEAKMNRAMARGVSASNPEVYNELSWRARQPQGSAANMAFLENDILQEMDLSTSDRRALAKIQQEQRLGNYNNEPTTELKRGIETLIGPQPPASANSQLKQDYYKRYNEVESLIRARASRTTEGLVPSTIRESVLELGATIKVPTKKWGGMAVGVKQAPLWQALSDPKALGGGPMAEDFAVTPAEMEDFLHRHPDMKTVNPVALHSLIREEAIQAKQDAANEESAVEQAAQDAADRAYQRTLEEMESVPWWIRADPRS